MKNVINYLIGIIFFLLINNACLAQTTINIRAVAGIGYAVDWVHITYLDANGMKQQINHEENIPLGQETTIVVPAGATNIRMTAKQWGSVGSSRIFNNLSLASGLNYCFHLTGAVNSPEYKTVNCNNF